MNTGKELIIHFFPNLYDRYVLDRRFGIRFLRKSHRQSIKKIRSKGQARAVFIMASLSMWRLEPVCKELLKDNRFHVHIIICPFLSFVKEQQKECTQELIDYCMKKGWDYETWFPGEEASKSFEADIIFYPQLYSHLFGNALDCEKNLHRLIAYVPYGLPTVSGDWMYNSRYMNTVWKLLFPTHLHLKYAKNHSFNHAKNMEIVGDSHAKEFLLVQHNDYWKEQPVPKKRIIWAPHFSIGDNGYLHRASFLWLSATMPKLAAEYSDRVQFVFKPHPRLMSELYRHPDWGKDKTDAYFKFWEIEDNTQLETGAYVDLFCTSDGMIHDCGSFTAEYLYTGKPVLFVSHDFNAVYKGLDLFGTQCLDLHYHANNESLIRQFLDEIILGGKDPMFSSRKVFQEQYLTSEGNLEFEKKIHKSLVKALFGS